MSVELTPIGALTLAEAKAWLVVEHDEDNELIRDLIEAAETYTENYCGLDFSVAVPGKLLKVGIKSIVAHWYENREPIVNQSINEMPLGVRNILNQHRGLNV